MVRKSNNLNNKSKSQPIINENTGVLLSIKTIVVVIGFIFVVVFGFYRIVIEPRLIDFDKRINLVNLEQKEMFAQIINVNNNVIALKASIDMHMLDYNRNQNLSTYYIFDENLRINDKSNKKIIPQTQLIYNHQKILSFYQDFVHKKSNALIIPLRPQ